MLFDWVAVSVLFFFQGSNWKHPKNLCIQTPTLLFDFMFNQNGMERTLKINPRMTAVDQLVEALERFYGTVLEGVLMEQEVDAFLRRVSY